MEPALSIWNEYTVNKKKLGITLTPFTKLSSRETEAIKTAAVKYGDIHNLQVMM